MEKPKECPFCGAGDVFINGWPGGKEYWGHCNNCAMCGPASKTKKDALSLWNTRPIPKLICPDCGEELVKHAGKPGEYIVYRCGCRE